MATERNMHNNSNGREENEGGPTTKELILGFQTWLRYILSKWQILLIAGLIGGAIGLVYSFFRQSTYTATTTFVLESSNANSGLGRLAGMAAIAGIDIGGDAGGLFEGDNILELYKSRNMLSQTLLDKLYPDSDELLIERYITFNNIREGWAENPSLMALDFKQNVEALDSQSLRLRDSVITSFVNAIRSDVLSVVKNDKNLSIIKVDVTSPDETFSKTFNERLVSKVNDFYVESKTKKSADNIAILEYKVDSVRNVMNNAIYSAAQASDATPNLNPTRQVQRLVPTQEAQFVAETNKLMLSQLLQNLELAKMTLLQEQPLIQLVDKPVYPLTVDRLGKKKSILIGGFLCGFLMLLFVLLQKYYQDIMSADN